MIYFKSLRFANVQKIATSCTKIVTNKTTRRSITDQANRSTHRIVQSSMDYNLYVVNNSHCESSTMLNCMIWQCILNFVSQAQLEIVIMANKKHRDLSQNKHRQWIKSPLSLVFDSSDSNSTAYYMDRSA